MQPGKKEKLVIISGEHKGIVKMQATLPLPLPYPYPYPYPYP